MSSLLNGLIIREQSGFFWVETDDGTIYICRLRGRLLEEAQASDIAAIGDRVDFVVTTPEVPSGLTEQTGMIEAVRERHSVLSRAVRTTGNRGAGQAEREHVLIANAEQAFFVFAATKPAPNLRMLDRFLVAGEKSGIDHLIIVINKIDLEDPANIEALFAPYARMGYTILKTSALDGHGVDILREHLRGKLSVFTGPSGVGKTSLLNRIQPGLGRAVKEVSNYDQKGVHTTRDSALVKLEAGGYLADTPGIRQMTLWDVEPEEVDGYFRDIAPLVSQCRFGDCTHTSEPGCAVLAAVERGEVSRNRLESLQQIREELAETYLA